MGCFGLCPCNDGVYSSLRGVSRRRGNPRLRLLRRLISPRNDGINGLFRPASLMLAAKGAIPPRNDEITRNYILYPKCAWSL
jgi:hypothetical protein